MNDNDRNTRTLIVCFVLAIMTLIPMRFVELRNGMIGGGDDYQVLGEYSSEVVLPNEVVDMEESVGGCLAVEEVNAILDEMKARIDSGELTEVEVGEVINQMMAVESSSCEY